MASRFFSRTRLLFSKRAFLRSFSSAPLADLNKPELLNSLFEKQSEITFGKFIHFLSSHGKSVYGSALNHVIIEWENVDHDKNYAIGREDCIRILNATAHQTAEKRNLKLFEDTDKDGDGKISVGEFIDILTENDITVPRMSFHNLLSTYKSFDTEEGCIDFTEFQSLMFRTTKTAQAQQLFVETCKRSNKVDSLDIGDVIDSMIAWKTSNINMSFMQGVVQSFHHFSGQDGEIDENEFNNLVQNIDIFGDMRTGTENDA